MSKAAVLTATRTLTLEDRPALLPAEGEVLIDVEHTGVCGTDLALFSGDYPVPLPLVCGHEFVGRVREVGASVDSNWKDQRVVAEINNTCLALGRTPVCRACRTGLPSHCQQRTVTGIIAKDGAFAEQVTVPAGALHIVPESLDPLVAVLTEPLAAALQTFEITPIKEKANVVVVGPGRLGILIVFVAALKGLHVTAVSRSKSKRQRAIKFGAQEAWSPSEAKEHILQATEDFGADLVVDATGSPEGTEHALSLVRPRGVVSIKTTSGLPVKGIDMTRLVVDEISLQGTRCGPFKPALELLSQHQELLKTLITSVCPLEQAQSAVESAFVQDKVVLDMTGK